MVALGEGTERVAVGRFVAVEPEAPFTYQFGIERRYWFITGKLNESLEVEVIVLGGFLAAATLDLDVLDEITNQLGKIMCLGHTLNHTRYCFILRRVDLFDLLVSVILSRMTILESIVLGAVQGLTEFIPISSSGHLVIAQYFMSGASEHLFLEWINIGTVLALLIYFRQRIIDIVTTIITKKDYRLAVNIIIAMLPAGLVGFIAADFIETSPFFSSPWVVAATLTIVGVLLIIVDKLPHRSKITPDAELPHSRAFIIGLAQVMALVPGTSRSGSTIIAGRLMGLSAARAAEFSFLVSIPIMLGVIAKLAVKSADRTYFMNNLTPLVVGNIVALTTGLLAVGFLMRYLEKHSLAVFGWYRIVLSVVLVTVLLLQ